MAVFFFAPLATLQHSPPTSLLLSPHNGGAVLLGRRPRNRGAVLPGRSPRNRGAVLLGRSPRNRGAVLPGRSPRNRPRIPRAGDASLRS